MCSRATSCTASGRSLPLTHQGAARAWASSRSAPVRTVAELAATVGGGPVVLVAHGGVIRSLLARRFGPPAPVPNGAVVALEVGEDGTVDAAMAVHDHRGSER